MNILTIPTHAAYETNLAKTGHEFWALNNVQGCKQSWDTHNRKLPNNYHLISEVPSWLKIDVVLSQHKFGQYQYLASYAISRNIPLISLEHTLPIDGWTSNKKNILKNMHGDIDVFISEYSKEKWGFGSTNAHVIHHGIDTDFFTNECCYMPQFTDRIPRILSVVNDWINRDYCCGYSIWKRVTDGLPVFPVGDTTGLSKPAECEEELLLFYQTSRIFINTSTISPIPTALLEAMSCGCACVSTNNCMIPEIIQDGFNGFITNDEKEMRIKLNLLLNDVKLAEELGNNARLTIQKMFGLNDFINNWNQTFMNAVKYGTGYNIYNH